MNGRLKSDELSATESLDQPGPWFAERDGGTVRRGGYGFSSLMTLALPTD